MPIEPLWHINHKRLDHYGLYAIMVNMIKRLISRPIQNDLQNKIVLLSGPRQCGKTTLSKSISKSFDYLNFDIPEDRLALIKQEWDRRKELIIFDEIHKMNKWKSWLKGIYDGQGVNPKILVTGSARMDIAKKAGDSLAGRHFQYQLFPFDLKELKGSENPNDIYKRLVTLSGFPEPYLSNKEGTYTKWKRSHSDLILRQDLVDLENVREISSIETLVQLLRTRIASPLSYSSVAGDLQRDTKTVQRWMKHLESLYLIFTILPYSKNIARSILKEPKIYFFDTAMPLGDEGVFFENLIALSLKKEVAYLNEALGIESSLHTLRQKGGNEIDFLVLRKNLPPLMIEAKLSDDLPSPNFSKFEKYFPNAIKIQLVMNLKREKTTPNGVEVRSALHWLTEMDLAK